MEKAVGKALDKDKIEMAKKGIKAGFSNSVIQTKTGMTDEQIDGLRKPF